MESKHCVSCGHELAPDFKLCPNCGEKTHFHRFNIPHLIHEFFHALTHADKSAFSLLKDLATKPGVVLNEYIIEGKRKKYFNPFTFLLIVLGFSVFMNSIFHPFLNNQYITEEQIVTAKTKDKKALYQRMTEKQTKMNDFMEKRANVVTFLSAPFMALAFWLVFKGKGLSYTEHLVAYLILTSILSLFSSITFVPLMAIVPKDKFYIVAFGNLIIQFVYTSFAYSKFVKLKGIGEIFMVPVANVLGIVFWMTLMMLATLVYFLAF